MSKVRYSLPEVLAALDGSAGIISAVAARLGCTWDTAKHAVNRWEETRAAFASERERVLDLAESAIVKSIQAGDTQDAKWVLSRLGKHRGYGDQVQISGTGKDGAILIGFGEDVSKL